jgi:site-specific DNA-methyltransferase (adenine-specific)
MTIDVMHGDCRDVLPTLSGLDACVTDPPYGLGFMGRAWDRDGVAFQPDTWRLVLDALKPGAHLVAFGGTRTWHRLAVAIEDAGFEIRDTLCWLYGSGFPKSLDVGKAIDKAAGAEREVIGRHRRHGGGNAVSGSMSGPLGTASVLPLTAPATPEAAAWAGWGTALKPAWEPIILARKPLDGTNAQNVLRHGIGGLNIDACRIAVDWEAERGETWLKSGNNSAGMQAKSYMGRNGEKSGSIADRVSDLGRWPANVLHDGSDEVLEAFAAYGDRPTGNLNRVNGKRNMAFGMGARDGIGHVGDSGSAARFFYSAKASAADRAGSKHPTVKPIALMRWLVRLVCPIGGLILDPFAGSGTTGEAAVLEGMRAVLIEGEAQYVADIRRRIARWSGQDAPLFEAAQ